MKFNIMSFYKNLQLSVFEIKNKIKTTDKKNKNKLYFILIIKNLLTIIFALSFIIGFSILFGKNNSGLTVSFFCILLQIRFIDYGYNVIESIINLFIISSILLLNSFLVPNLNPFISFILNLIFLTFIILSTCHNPKLGNIAVYVDSYLFSTFLPSNNINNIKPKLIETIICFLLCSIVFIYKHYKKNKNIKFKDILSDISLNNKVTQWQLRLILGISLILLIGQSFNIKRYFWLGIACMAILAIYEPSNIKVRYTNINKRIIDRVIGIIIGSVLFAGVYNLIPRKLDIIIGPMGGFLMGFTTTYRWSTIFNCFGALMMATSLYGIQGSVFLRVFDNVLSCFLTIIFMYAYKKAFIFLKK